VLHKFSLLIDDACLGIAQNHVGFTIKDFSLTDVDPEKLVEVALSNRMETIQWELDLAVEELGLEIVAVPIANKSEVLHSAQVLINKKIDAIYQISDNTINASFEAVGNVAEENAIPLFGGFLLSTHLGACAALGWDFFDMGYKAGEIAFMVKNSESPARIPIQYMSKVRMHLNLHVAEKQGIKFSDKVLKKADEVVGVAGN